ncbi:MAG: glycoside hydrolase family 1 [Chlorobi bacterium]|nr:glycoside hydrolase family 1 [Chlorobiota bacterium]
MELGTSPKQFIWASGIENTFVPQSRPGYRPLEEYELMGHYEHWREDLALARDLGVRGLRWGIPWYRVEPQQGVFDWSWTDQVIPYLVRDLGITPIIDLMHYGCPLWLQREFVNRDYPRAVAAYAAAFAERYSTLIKLYTPLNEPLVNSLMCGKRGVWPPYLRGDAGYIRMMLQLVRGIIETVEAIKSVDPASVMVHVEATGLTRAVRDDLHALAMEDQHRGYLYYDLITGRVDRNHPLFPWLIRNGASPDDLAAIAARKIPIDMLGLNFYPQWSTQQLYLDPRGRLAYRATEQDGSGFAVLIEDFHRRYQAPIIVTETSAFGSDELRAAWLDASLGAVRGLRGRGVPVVGYTWFPLFTMIDWRYRFGRGPVDQYRLELGLFRLKDTMEGDRDGRWSGTPLVEHFCRYVNNPEMAVGPFVPAETPADETSASEQSTNANG